MTDDEFRVGAHVSVAGGVDNAVERQCTVGGTCGQIFTHSPQVWAHTEIEEGTAAAFREASARRLDGPWVIHASYLVNLCTPDPELRDRSVASLQRELDAAALLDVEYVNVHLGAHTGAGKRPGLENAVDALDRLTVPEDVTVLLETDAGAGTKLGNRFEHLAFVRERTAHDVACCLDTAHCWAAGYDLSDTTGVADTIETFDDVIGLEALACIHLNDSKHGRGTNKDEHEHLGEGEIGESGIQAMLTHPALATVPFVLETPNEPDVGKGFDYDIDCARQLRSTGRSTNT